MEKLYLIRKIAFTDFFCSYIYIVVFLGWKLHGYINNTTCCTLLHLCYVYCHTGQAMNNVVFIYA